MIGALALLLVCQLAGEAAARALALPVPGPVVGMALLFVGLALRGAEPPPALAQTAKGLLSHLSLLFVPAGVGVIAHAELLARDGWTVAAALLASTLLAMGVTAFVLAAVERLRGGREG